MAASPDSPRGGLRERKREQTRTSIQLAAVELMTEHGFADTTIEMICAEADVSRRTFFNYFASKEAVVIGSDPGPIPEGARRAFVEGPPGSILADLARMLLTVISQRPRHIDPQIWRARLELLRGDITLAKAFADKIAAKNTDLEDLVAERIRSRYRASVTATNGGNVTADLEPAIARQTGFIVAMWWGIARYAIQTSIEHPEISDEDLIESLLDTLTLIQEAEL